MTPANPRGWDFWIDRGGTFTDIVARRPDGELISHKLLSANPERYAQAELHGIRELLGLRAEAPLTNAPIASVRMGTTVATNALLERKGDPTVLLITRGFGDALRIGYQNRPDLFAQHIRLPQMLYTRVIEADERIGAAGEILTTLNETALRDALAAAYAAGYRALAIAFMHAYRFPQHEQRAGEIARDTGFTQVSASHATGALMKLISRGDTSVVDAYLSPLLRRHVETISAQLGGHTRLTFMQSNGGLTAAAHFQGRNSILSGPAAGVVAVASIAKQQGLDKVLGFDMGGTSTDVSLWAGELPRSTSSEIAGIRLRASTMRIHTVAAGGGSILRFAQGRFQVGPESAGANPGPACYGAGGPLTVTDANLLLGRIRADYFPAVFGADGNAGLDAGAARAKFAALTAEINSAQDSQLTPTEVASGFLRIAEEKMATAIKQVSIRRGHDPREFTLLSYGGAGAQHACAIAEHLGIPRVLIHPLAGVMSALGMGLARASAMRMRSVETRLGVTLDELRASRGELQAATAAELATQGLASDDISFVARLELRYEGSDTGFTLPWDDDPATLQRGFVREHERRFGYAPPDAPLVIAHLEVEAFGPAGGAAAVTPSSGTGESLGRHVAVFDGEETEVPFYARDALADAAVLAGPAIVVAPHSTLVVPPRWSLSLTADGSLHLEHSISKPLAGSTRIDADPVLLEVFNNLYMHIAEQMGAVLENTAHSVNIKERLDFSCGVFDCAGNLVANAPHMPVHLGSMGETVRAALRAADADLQPGDAWLLNDPYHGGTHLPDMTVVTPVFDAAGENLLGVVASRGHHADIGGVSPGSMPPLSRSIEEEGVRFTAFRLLERGEFREAALRAKLSAGPWPARSPDRNVADLQAQLAANERGAAELRAACAHYGSKALLAYMGHMQDNAARCVRDTLARLDSGQFRYALDNGQQVSVRVDIDKEARRATVDFTGTSAQADNNFNAPAAVCRAAVLYVFRTLVEEDIPMNAGCLRPIELIIPRGSMLNPEPPAAVVAGNVETSQVITDALFGALGKLAAAQGTMNNLTFGNERFQYYETICGGSGAGTDFPGTDAVHTHMTNSRITDPEVLEARLPVRLHEFAIRRDSGGAGRHSGGNGVVRRLEFLEAAEVAILSNRRSVPPFGLDGGAPGRCGSNRVVRRDGSVEILTATAQTELRAGDQLVIETPGGGGFGAPPDATDN